ncbi:MAG: hypothetical protein Kow001_06500 [Acidobacteriota bacterium]
MLRFLREGEVVGDEPVKEGINRTRKLTLELDGRRMHAAFRTVRLDQYLPDPLDPSFSQNHRDDYRFEVAAYRLSRILGLRLVPPTIIRRIGGKEGSLQAWVEDAAMEKTRRREGRQPPDEWYWMSQMLAMHVFDNLVGNVDRHQGNVLIDGAWEVWLIDHTQAFRRWPRLHSPGLLQYCQRDLWLALQNLDSRSLERCCGEQLREPERRSLLRRRDLLIEHFRKLIAERGADQVLY